MKDCADWIRPDWPAPPNVHALVTTRNGGVSAPPWDTLNPATHVGDDPAAVAENRRRIRTLGGLPSEPLWLSQVHGSTVADDGRVGQEIPADGRITRRPGRVCAVLTADCLPVLLCNRQGTAVAALHAGWRGLAAGVLEAGVAAFAQPPEELLAWLGPCISQAAYEVGAEVHAALLRGDPGAGAAFLPTAPGRWRLDLEGLARHRLARAGVRALFGGGFCTFGAPDRFFSHRRDGTCGRLASLVWFS
ncbi:MAG: peptidoglycan editing factor PgeF [Gammaproteobacteria bacterium]|nr:MAG: peptidoglycan editing factor PgeF [Gammaproteobacteria bacterium]